MNHHALMVYYLRLRRTFVALSILFSWYFPSVHNGLITSHYLFFDVFFITSWSFHIFMSIQDIDSFHWKTHIYHTLFSSDLTIKDGFD